MEEEVEEEVEEEEVNDSCFFSRERPGMTSRERC